MITYLRGGPDLRVVHTPWCPRITLTARLLGRVRPWKWSTGRSSAQLTAAIHNLRLRPCRTCKPFIRGDIQ